MRVLITTFLSLLAWMPFMALAQGSSSKYSPSSSSGITRRAGSFQIAPGYGYAWFRSSGLDSLNARLGNSALVSQPETHGRAGYIGGYAWFPDEYYNRFWSASFTRIGDSLSASGAGATVNSQYTLWSVGAGYGVRLYPFARNQFHPKDIVQKARINRRSAKFLNRIYWMGLINLEAASISQKYALFVPSTDTNVKYSASAWHIVAVPTLRVALVLHPSFHIYAEGGAGMSICVRNSAVVESLIVRSQDQRYRAVEAGVGEFVSSPFQIMRGLVGVTVQF